MNGRMYSHFPVKSVGESVAKFCKAEKYFGDMLEEWQKIVVGKEIKELLVKFKYNNSHVQQLQKNLDCLIRLHKTNKLQFYRS